MGGRQSGCRAYGSRKRLAIQFGLDDLFDRVVPRNPARVSVDTYRRRIKQKQYPKALATRNGHAVLNN
jgi:hypothetical protein